MTGNEETVADWVERVTRAFEAAGLHYGHGTATARDEAAWLVLHAVGAPLDGSFNGWGQSVGAGAAETIRCLTQKRCSGRQPLAYLIGTARFAGLEFEVGPEVLIPRSPIAELILDGFRPWARPDRLGRMLDMCTGSGCIAVAAAHHLPGLQVDAADISAAALEIAARNVARHGVGERVHLYRSDLFKSLPALRYDLITANPPYVPAGEVSGLPEEYRAEPALALASGSDGLDATLSLLLDAPDFLGDDGVLICEVGASEEALTQALPQVPFLWLEFESGGSGVFVLTREQLLNAHAALAALLEERKDVV